MGEILIAGTAALLICVFLSPTFIATLRRREFGQHIRPEGPEGHHAKAGTPTMGGIIIFAAISIPFLILSDYDWRSIGVYGAAILSALLGFADDAQKIFKRRSLGLQGRWKLIVTAGIAGLLWWIATQKAGLAPTLRLRTLDATIDLGVFYPVLIYLVVAGTTNAVNLTDGLDGLAAGLRGHRAPGVHRHHVHHRRSGGPRAAVRLPRRRRASDSSGTTRSRPRSSWATRGRWGWAAPSRGSR